MERFGNFSSSEIYKLIKIGSVPMTEKELEEHKKQFPKSRKKNKEYGFQDLGNTYIAEKKMELRLGRGLSKDHDAKPTNWGKLMEPIVFEEYLDISYSSMNHRERLSHPTIEHWTGIPDTLNDKNGAVGDVKCPYTLKSFCEGVDAATEGLESFKESKPEWYWQLVSNAILTDSKNIEIIMYLPYKRELDLIRERASNYDGEDQFKFGFVNWASDEALPYLIEGNHYKNINKFVWECPQEDKDLLTERVTLAVEFLTKHIDRKS